MVIHVGGNVATLPAMSTTMNQKILRQWWHNVLRLAGNAKYGCYIIFLLLPSDQEARRYLASFGKELDLLSGEHCLVIALGEDEFRRSGFDETMWREALDKHISEGHSVTVAKLFGVKFDSFPCIVVFRDIRSPQHVLVSLKDLTSEEIAQKLRALFSVIGDAIVSGEDPVDYIERSQQKEDFLKKGKSIISGLRTFAGNSFQTAIEAWLKSVIQ